MARFAQLVKDARNERGLTQAELAERSQKSKSWIVDVERGKTLPADIETIAELAGALHRDSKEFWETIVSERNQSVSRTLPDGILEEFGDWMLTENQPEADEDEEIVEADPRSYQDCAEHAERIVGELCGGAVRTGSSIPIMKVLTYKTSKVMKAAEPPAELSLRAETSDDFSEEGRTEYDEEQDEIVVKLRNDIWRRAQEGEGRSRFTAAHELGHALLHSGLMKKHSGKFFREFLRTASEKLPEDVPIYCSPDYQANSWAGAFLLPTQGVRQYLKRMQAADEETSIEKIARHFDVSVQAARIRIEKMLPNLVDFGEGGLDGD